MYTLIEETFSSDANCYFDEVIFVSRSKQVLEAKRGELIKQYRYEIDVKKKLNDHMKRYHEKCPHPKYIPLPKKYKYPAGISEKDITPEMRAKRAEWVTATHEAENINRELMNGWYKLYNDSCHSFLLYDFGMTDEKERDKFVGYYFISEKLYSIKEVEELI